MSRKRQLSYLVGALSMLGALAHSSGISAADFGKPSPLNGVKGKQIKIVWSGNDTLCKKVFKFYDKHYEPKKSAIRHEEDDMFVQWNKATNIIDTPRAEWTKADVDNDGKDDLLFRNTYYMGGVQSLRYDICFRLCS